MVITKAMIIRTIFTFTVPLLRDAELGSGVKLEDIQSLWRIFSDLSKQAFTTDLIDT